MRIQEIIDFVADRTGEKDPTQVIREINNSLRELWYTQDIEGSLAELDVLPNAQRIVTLPWYVFQTKGVKRIVGEALRLNTPRAAFHDFNYAQSTMDVRILSRSPLFLSMENPGPVTLKLRKAANESFTVTVRGPDSYGVDNTEDVNFSPAEKEHTTTGSYVDITALSKSVQTVVDVEVRDITGSVISIIPAGQTEVWCLRAQIFDRNTIASVYPCNGYTILFKKWAPYIRSANDVVQDPLGVILQSAVTAARLGVRTDDAAMKQTTKFESRAKSLIDSTAKDSREGFMLPLDLKASPWTSLYPGTI